jgi:hypothetical protein
MNREELTKAEIETFHEALGAAFSSSYELKRLVSSQLNVDLELISSRNDNLSVVVYELIRWCLSQGRISQLVEGAYRENPANLKLMGFVASWRAARTSMQSPPPMLPKDHHVIKASAGTDMLEKLEALANDVRLDAASNKRTVHRNPVERNQVFISYTHVDAKWLKQLQLHLKPLIRADKIKVWDDTMIAPGSNWRDEIEKAIKSAKVAILLITANYLASDFVVNEELPPLLAAAEQEGAVILPVIIGHCRFAQTKSISRFQAINDPSQPLDGLSGSKRGAVFVKLTDVVESSLLQARLSPKPVAESNRVKAADHTPKLRVDSNEEIWIGGKRKEIELPNNEQLALKLLWDTRGTPTKASEFANIIYGSDDKNAIYAVQRLMARLQRFLEVHEHIQYRYIAKTTAGYRLINYEDDIQT